MSNRKEETLYHAMFLAQHLNKCDLKDGLVYILFELDVDKGRLGYHYVKDAILLFHKDPIHTLLSGIYQKVAENIDPFINSEYIEKNIRDVIGKSYRDCEPEIWAYYFPEKAGRKPSKPNNYKFISNISAFMELWQACCKEASYEI
ncbi:MAG: hypothetical protein IKT52_02610 [Oscillospiraceae bacterium]|nr:hypothetical protein [Oscillospiraceae bacterium]